MNFKNISIILVVLIAALSRFIPHPPNFTPIIAMGLFSGFYFKNNKILALLVPIMAMAISDIYFGFSAISIVVYFSLGLIVFIGHILPNNQYTTSFHNILMGSLAGSITFFIVSNFGVFLIGYPKTIYGLIACYTAAIPFFANTVCSTLIFSTVIFLCYDVIKDRIPQLNSDIA